MSYLLDTAAKYITQGSAAIPQTGSMQLWVFPTWAQTDGIQHIFFGTYNGSGTVDFDIQKFSDNQLYAGWNTVGGTDSRVVVASAGYTLNQNAWNHIVLTWTSGGTCTLYLNGTSIGTSSTITTYSTAGTTRVIGADNAHVAGVTVSARVAEYAVWNKVLTAAEVTALYNSGSNAQLASQQENASLVDYCPLWGTAVVPSEINLVSGGTNPTKVGNPATAAHAPMVLYVIQRATSNAVLNHGSFNLTSTPAVNNAIIVRAMIRCTGGISSPTCTDNQTPANTYSLVFQASDGGDNAVVEFLGKAVTASGTFTLTLSYTGNSGTMEMEAVEVYPALFVDKSSTASGTGTSATPGSVTPSTTPEFLSTVVVDAYTTDNLGTLTVPSLYFLMNSDTGGAARLVGGTAVSTQGVAAAVNPAWTINNVAWACGQATYSTSNVARQPPVKAFAHQANNRMASPQVKRVA